MGYKKLMKNELEKIIKNKLIYPVFQPIVELKTGKIVAYEALSRIAGDSTMNIGELFELACRTNRVWELEAVCRRKALKQAADLPEGTKLFLNVDPNVILDPKMQSGATSYLLKKHGVDSSAIVFEVTERTPIKSERVFTDTVRHYREEKFQIAIDDFGAEFAGVNRVCLLRPEYIKLDMAIIRHIDENALERSFVRHFSRFCQENGIKLVAEGIETEEELVVLTDMGVGYGQGFYLYKPERYFVGSGQERQEIKKEG